MTAPRLRVLFAAPVLVALLALGGCTSGHQDVSKPAGLLLHAQVQALRQSARAASRAEARQRLDALESSVTKLRAQGDLSASAAARIRGAAASVATQLVLIPLPTTTTTTTTTTTPAPRHGRGPDAGHGHSSEDHRPGRHPGDQPD